MKNCDNCGERLPLALEGSHLCAMCRALPISYRKPYGDAMSHNRNWEEAVRILVNAGFRRHAKKVIENGLLVLDRENLSYWKGYLDGLSKCR